MRFGRISQVYLLATRLSARGLKRRAVGTDRRKSEGTMALGFSDILWRRT